MTPFTQTVFMVSRLVNDPKPLKRPSGPWYALLKLWNPRPESEDGKRKQGPPFTVILVGKAAEPGMPIYTARKGCGVYVVGRISLSWSKKRGLSWCIESGFVNVLYHPSSLRYFKYANSESSPPMHTALIEEDPEEVAETLPIYDGEYPDFLGAFGAEVMEREADFTENQLTEVVTKRIFDAGIKAIRRSQKMPAPRRTRSARASLES